MPDVGGIAGAQLKSFIERIERLEDEKRVLGQDIKEVFAEAKAAASNRKSCARSSRSEEWTKRSTTNRRPCSTSTNAL